MSVRKSFPVPFASFGELTARRRLQAGFAAQQDLATALGIAQQTISRWEKGLSRPRPKDIPTLERLLGTKPGELARAAGYEVAPASAQADTATSYDRALPLSALAPATFESFCAELLTRRYRPSGGTVSRYGGPGQKQHGIDIVVTGPLGTHTFQCKRVDEFGAQKVHTVVAEQTYPADLKVLLLSNVASPKARDAMAAHKGWELWDREDLTRRLHELSFDDRIDLVDIYFNGKRQDLLGVEEAGPFQSSDDFFKPFLVPDRFFNHTWQVVGRDEEVAQVLEHVGDPSVVLTCLSGGPGLGKSRLLRHIVAQLHAHDASLRIKLVSPTEEVKAVHLDRLRSPEGNTVLVVDDAHEREDLGLLLRHAAVPDNRTRLLFALRPYGKEALRLQAAEVSLLGTLVRFVDMQPQTVAQATVLATEVLRECGGPISVAAEIAKTTYTTPLVTVLAAQLVAKNEVSIALLNNVADFRAYVLTCVQDVVAGKIATGQDDWKVRAILRVVALVQPIIPDDPGLLSILKLTEDVEAPDAARLLRLLNEAGILLKRGLRHRLAPDLLADEVIQANYINHDGTANQRVHAVFDEANAEQLKNLLVNLGRLDWRLREGATTDSVLLASLYPKLKWQEQYHNPHLEAVEAVAYYQPRLALDFAKRLIGEGHGDSSSVCGMLRNAAYTYDHLEEACKLLWLAGRGDARALHQQPSHGIRILKELAEFEPNKPVDYVQAVVRFALELLERPASLNFAYTPFAILEGPLSTEMETTTSSRMTLTIHRYQLPLTVAQEVRDEVTNSLLRFIREGPPRRAFLAAQTMSEALRGPMHGDTSDGAWSREHQKLLRAMLEALKGADVSPVVLMRAAQSASWHAFYGPTKTQPDAHAVLQRLDRDLPTRLVRALVDGWGTDTWELSEALEREAHVADRARLTQELRNTFPAVSELSELLEMWMAEIASIAGDGYGASFLLVNHLLERVEGFAIDVIERCSASHTSRLANYVGKALSVVIAADETSLVDDFLLRSRNSVPVLRQVSEAYARFESNRTYRPSEIELFKRIFQSKDEVVGRHAASLVQQVAKRSPALAVELVCAVDLEAHPRAIHEMFMWLSSEKTIPPNELRARRRELLKKLLPLPKLEDHWVLKFLSSSMREDAPAVVELVQDRLKEASRRKDWTYTPLRKEHRGDGLGLLGALNGPRLLRELLEWGLLEVADHAGTRRLGEAVAGLCGKYDKTLFEVLLSFLATPTSERATLVAAVLREAQNDFIYESPTFIREVLNAAELVSQAAVDDLHAAIVAATRSGMRGGVVGQPFPEDVKLEQHASQMLATLSRADPAYDLYDDLLKDAQHSISRQEKTRAAMENDEIDAE